ncbi:MAG: ABC transporter substrate-binding protein, partial [Fervidobacterium sp.]
IIGGDGLDSEEFVKIGKEAVNNTYYVSHFAKDDPNTKIQAFIKNYKDRFGKEPNVESVLCYDSLMMLAKAIEKAGSVEPNVIRDALSTLEFNGVTGIIKFENGGDPVKPATIVKVTKGVQTFETRIYPP